MKSGPLPAVLEHLRKWASPEASALSDAELLARFCAGREEADFAILMRRHGRMVWGVCRHVLGHEQDAEDAFQATFLVLARKAVSIRKGTAVASWLHGTAYHIASRARRNAALRRARESKGESMSAAEPICESSWREVLAILDEEVQRLSERQRSAFVLCTLEGKSLAEAARQLGWKEGTLSGTLSRAHEQLRRRLVRRGVTLTAVLAGLAVSGESAAPAALVERTCRAALAFAAGKSIHGAVSPSIAFLVREATRSLAGAKLRVLAVVLTAAVAVAGVAEFVGQEPESRQEASAATAPRRAEQPKSEGTTRRRTDLYGDPLPSGALARLGTVRLRREDGVCGDFAFTPDGKTLVSARNGKVVQFWDVTTGSPLRALRHEKKFDAFALSVNGKILVSAGSGEIAVWDVGDSKQIRKIRAAEIDSLAVAPDGKMLASADKDRVVRLWDLTTGEGKYQIAGRTGNACSILFAPDGKTLLWAGEDAAVHVWDVAAKRQVRKFGTHARCLALSRDGAVLAAGGSEVVKNTAEARLTLWNAATGRRRLQLRGHEHFVESVAFAPDGKTLASSEVETIYLWDVATGKEVRRIDKGGWRISRLAFSPDGKTLASTAPGNETVVRLWDVATGKPLQPAGPDGVVRAVAFSPDGQFVATGCWLGHDHPLRVWDAATGKPLWACPSKVGNIDRIIFTHDGQGLFTSSTDGVPRLWDARTGKEVRRYPISEGSGPVVEIALSAGGKRLTAVAGEAGTNRSAVIVWDVRTGKRLLRRQGEHPSLLNILSFSSDGEIAAEPKGKILRLWEVATDRQLLSLEPSNLRPGARLEESTAFSSDGRTVAAITFASARRGEAPQPAECAVHLWELATGKPSLRIAAGKDRLEAVAFAPDGRTLATAGKGVLQLWDVATGEELLAYHGQEANVFLGALAFSPDGTRLIAGYLDSTALVWDLMPGRRRAGVSQKDLGRVDLGRLWSDLSSADAVKAHAALWALTAGRERTVVFLSERLRPAKEDAERIRRLIADLDSEQFAVRETARRTLEQLGAETEPQLRKALEGKPSVELRKRLETLLAGPRIVYSPEVARQIRAVQVLEQMGSKEARRHLAELAGGAPAARLTREAKMSLQRLSGRTVREP